MAVYHLDAYMICRSKGHSAVAAAAYRAGERIVETRTGEVHDYRRRHGVDHREILAPRGAPGWCKSRPQLWNRAEGAECRRDAQTARQVEVALPRELPFKHRRRLLRKWVRRNFVSRGMVADISYHDQDGDNPHAHVLLTMRRLAGKDRFCRTKERDWNAKAVLEAWRSSWAGHQNAFLRRAGCESRVDHRTLEAQRADAIATGDVELAAKLDRAPGRHVGRAAGAIQARADQIAALAAAQDDAIRSGEADQPDYEHPQYNAAAYVDSSRIEQLANERERENEARREIREGEVAVDRESRLDAFCRQPGGYDVYCAACTSVRATWDLTPSGLPELPASTFDDRALDIAESYGGCLERLRVVFEDPTGTSYYRTIVDAHGDRVTLKDIHDAIDEANRRVQADRDRRECRLRRLFARSGGRDLFMALCGTAEEPSASTIDQVLDAAESEADLLGRLDMLFRKSWGRAFYAARIRAVAERITRAEIDAAALAGEAFARRVRDVVEGSGGRVQLDAAPLEREDATVAELESALEQAEERRREERREAEQEERAERARIEAERRAADDRRVLAERGRLAAVARKLEGLRAEDRREAETAARDAGIDVATILERARSDDRDEAAALWEASAARRDTIRKEARDAGLDDDAIDSIRLNAEPEDPDLGWAAVVEATTVRHECRKAAEIAARALDIDVDAAYQRARHRGEDQLDYLERRIADCRRIEAAAREALLDDAAISRIRLEAESKLVGSGWTALSEATAERVERKVEAESAARDVGIDVDAAYAHAREGNDDALDVLERQTADCRRIEAAAREALLDDAAIARIRREAETKLVGSEWTALSEATVERVERKVKAESAARDVGIDIDAAYAHAREGNDDALDVLERQTADRRRIEAAAREALLDDAAIARIRREAESQKAGSGWAALATATEERATQKEAAEAAARRLSVDVDAVYADAQERERDPVAALTRANAERKEEHRIRAAAQHVFLGGETLDGIRREAEMQEAGSGWAAVEEEIGRRQEQKTTLEEAARGLGLNVDFVYANAPQHGTDPLVHLEQTTAIWRQALQAGLDHNALDEAYARAEERQAGTGWTALSNATRRRELQRALEEAARREFVNIPAVYEEAGLDGRDPLRALEQVTKARREIREEVEAAALDAGVDVGTVYKEARAALMNPVVAVRGDILGIVRRTSGGKALLEKAGWSTSLLTHRQQVRVLRAVAQQLAEDVAGRETEIGAEPDGSEWLRRARLEVLDADRPPKTLAERSAIVDAAEASRQAESERRWKAEVEECVERRFAEPGGDRQCFKALDQIAHDWRTKGTRVADVERALGSAESDPGPSPSSAPVHAVVVETERAHPDTGSASYREVGAAFAGSDDIDRKAREASDLLADRARVREVFAGRSESPAAAGLVQRLVEWLRTRIARILGIRRTAGATPEPSPPVATANTLSPTEPPPDSAQRQPPTEAAQPELPATEAEARPRDVDPGEDAGRKTRTDAERLPEGRPTAVGRRPRAEKKQPGARTERHVQEQRQERTTREQEEKDRAFETEIVMTMIARKVRRGHHDPVYRPHVLRMAISETSRASIESPLTPMARNLFNRVMDQDDAGDAEQRAAAERNFFRAAIDDEYRRRCAEHKKERSEARGWFARMSTRVGPEPDRAEIEREFMDEVNRKLAAEIEQIVQDVLVHHQLPSGDDGGAPPPRRRPGPAVPEPPRGRGPSR